MAQYKVGTVTVTNGSATVTGSGTAWVANVPVGSYFVVAGDVVAYQVASRTDTQITLTAPYGGSSGSGRSYVAHVDFHSNGAPSFLDDDIESAAILNRWLVQSWPAAAFGTAATRNVMTSLTDITTPDALMPRGAFGVGSLSGNLTSDFSTLFTGPAQISRNAAFRTCLTMKYDASRGTQLELDISGNRAFIRGLGTAGGTPVTSELYHTGNLGESDTAWTTVTSLQNGWTGTVQYIKRGGMVTVSCSLSGVSATSGTVLTIPSGYRPQVSMRLTAANQVGNLLSNGNLDLTRVGDTSDTRFTITYPVIP